MNLYKVEVTLETVVLAESQLAAELLAEDIVKNEDDTASSVFATEIKDLKDLPAPWDGSCRPWGKTDSFDRTIKDILAAQTKSIENQPPPYLHVGILSM